MSSLRKHLTIATKNTDSKEINESLILSSIVCAACIGYAASPILNSEFMKSVGSGISSLLSGIGGLFGLVKKKAEDKKEDKKEEEKKEDKKNEEEDKIATLKAILKKDSDDMTGKEKEMLGKAANNPRLQKEFSNNELKKLNKAIGVSSYDDTNVDTEEYIKSGKVNAILLKIAAKANEEEKDSEKKKKMDAILDVAIASTYDENGNVLPLEEQRKKMKETVGEENWESFSKGLNTYVNEAKEADIEKLTKNIKSSYAGLSQEEREKIDDNQKKRAKEASERIAKEKAEQQKIDDEIADLQKQIEEKSKDSVMKDEANPEIEDTKKKIKELQDKRTELVNNSTLGAVSPSTTKAADNKDDKEDTKKDKDGNILNKEEVTDPETGKKIKVITHTGPRGGKFYYPKGKPKKPENKVYVNENFKYTQLSNYLLNQLNLL